MFYYKLEYYSFSEHKGSILSTTTCTMRVYYILAMSENVARQ